METLPSSTIKQNLAEDYSANKRKIKITRREKVPDSFDGTSCEWPDYKIQFELAAQIDWSDSEKVQYLILSLRDEARQLISGINSENVPLYKILTKSFQPQRK